MARFLFPDDPFLFRVSSPGSPLYSTTSDSLVIYADAGATTLADIQHVDHTTVFESALMLDGTAVIPQFYGPDGVTDLWAISPNGEIFQLTAASGPRLDAIEADLVGISAVRSYTATLGTVTGSTPYPVNYNLNNAFPHVHLFLISSPGQSGTRIPDALISNVTSTSPNSLTVTTVNSYSTGTVQITVVG